MVKFSIIELTHEIKIKNVPLLPISMSIDYV